MTDQPRVWHRALIMVWILISILPWTAYASERIDNSDPVIDDIFTALMSEHDIPGLAVAWSWNGEDHFHEYGVSDEQSGQTITRHTIFEIGSVSKLFVAAAAAKAELNGKLSLQDPVEKYATELQGTPFGDVPLLHLATHTAGGFPLQVPAEINSTEGLVEYLKAWQPHHPLGTHRSYANPSIGFLGRVVALASEQNFVTMMERGIFADLGLTQTFITVPDDAMPAYAWGHDREGRRSRVGERILGDEAYGVKTSSADLLRFLKLSLRQDDSVLSRALRRTQVGAFDAGPFVQAMIWERYTYPFDVCDLENGNSREMIREMMPVQVLSIPDTSRVGVALGKTGAMRGFGAYVLVVPEVRFAMLILANKNFPGSARVDAAYRAMSRLLGTPVTMCRR